MTTFSVLAALAAVATGLAGGVFSAFSTFVMSGLRRLDPAAGAAAMRSINRTAVQPPLMVLLAASVLLPAAAAVLGLVRGEAGTGWALAGAVVALVGLLGVTAAGNVPLNDRLDAATDPATVWVATVPRWLAWNHVRTAAGALAAVLLVVAVAA